MSLKCYTPRAEHRAALIGGLFIRPNNDSCLVPDHCLVKAELLSGSRMLKLTYSYCIVEVAGRCLDAIYEDACISKLGTIRVASPEECESAPDNQLCVASLVITPPLETEYSASEQEWING
jgi:hypothetical protein